MPPKLPVAVIGAGIIGACIAARLAEKNAPVLLLDTGEPGHGTTNASYAWVNANRKLLRIAVPPLPDVSITSDDSRAASRS